MQEIHFRKAGISDIPALCNMLDGLFSIETDFSPDREKQAAALEFLMSDRNAAVFVADAGTPAGMITGQIVISTAAGGYSVLIEDLFVMPEFRRKGIASLLINNLITWAVSAGAIRAQLVADSTNSPAIALYSGFGFSSGRMAGMYKLL